MGEQMKLQFSSDTVGQAALTELQSHVNGVIFTLQNCVRVCPALTFFSLHVRVGDKPRA